MKQSIVSQHHVDENGNPAGGTTVATGLDIRWQNGPLGRGEARIEPNGAFVETLLAAVLDRLEFYQSSRFNCHENAVAIHKIQEGLFWLQHRTSRREDAGVEGTHEGN